DQAHQSRAGVVAQLDALGLDTGLVQGTLDAFEIALFDGLGWADAGNLDSRIVGVEVGGGIYKAEQQHDHDKQVFPQRITVEHVRARYEPGASCARINCLRNQMAFRVPFGSAATTAPFWNFSSCPSLTSRTMNSSVTFFTLPRIPPLVTTSSPVLRLLSRFLCSLARLAWGRQIIR